MKTQFITSNEALLQFKSATLQIAVLGGIKLSSLDRLRVTLKITAKQEQFPLRYNLDLYNTDQVEKLIRRIADYFETDHHTIRKQLMILVDNLEKYRLQQLETTTKIAPLELTKEQEKQAIQYLQQKNLMQTTMKDIGSYGVIGEETNRLLMYLVFTSRKLQNPLHIITLGASGTGKTHLQEKVAELIPDADKIEITTLTKNALYYYGKEELMHKLLLIEDLDGTTEESMYAIRELQSKKRLSKTYATKDNHGNIKTQTSIVEGIVTIAGTTTKEKIYEDNANRSILIHLDNSEEQDNRIAHYQKQSFFTSSNKEQQQHLKEKYHQLQTVLQAVKIINPYAPFLKLPDSIKKPRRTLMLYLSLIEVITFYHQYQRKVKDGVIITTKEDIKWANKLLQQVFLNKSDELSHATRSTLKNIQACLEQTKKTAFKITDIKNQVNCSIRTLQRHLQELVENYHLQIIRGNRYTGYTYELTDAMDFSKIEKEIKELTTKSVCQE